MMKKVVLSMLAVVTVVALAITGTVAYLTWQESDVNVMTLGNVEIDQLEYERVVDENGNPVLGVEGEDFDADYGINQSYKLKEFTDGKPAYPAVYANGAMDWDEVEQLWNSVGAPGSNWLFDDSMKNVIDKFVFVKNTGKSDAYYRTIVAVEYPDGLSEQAIHLNFNTNSRFDYNDEMPGSQQATDANSFFTTIDGVRYLVYVASYTEILTPGEVSRPSLLQAYLDPSVTNEDCALFGESWDILVKTQAIQAAGFDAAPTGNMRSIEARCAAQIALDEGFEEITAENHPWEDGVEIPVVLTDAYSVHKSSTQSGTFILGSDIKTSEYGAEARYGYGYEYIFRNGADYTLDLNGKSIVFDTVNKNANNNALTYLFVANHAGTKLTIDGEGMVLADNSAGYTCAVQGKDGTLVTINGGDYQVKNGIAVWAGAGAHIVINGGSFINSDAKTNHELIYTSGGVIDIYGGFFHNMDGNYTLNVEDRNRATGFINVYGGTYVNFDPSTGGQDPNNIKVADGYKVVSETQANGDVWYTVVAK